MDGPDEVTSGPDDDAGMPYLSSREAADTLIAAVQRAGAPWEVAQVAALAGRDLGGAASWPVVLSDGEVVGVIVRNGVGRTPHDEVIRVLMRTVASLVAAEQRANEVTRRAAEAEHEARRDVLTGLANRRAWDAALEAESARMHRHGRSSLVAVVDLDGLKDVNDSQGHLAGDLLLREAARAIETAVREEDVVARIGGDEFAVLAVEAERSSLDTVAGRLRAALHEAGVDASVGAAAAEPGTRLVDAFHEADRLMYEIKQQRKER